MLHRLVEVIRDDEWQFREPHPHHEALVDDLRRLHEVLSPAGLDFGHRVMYESLRFAALLHASLQADRSQALDFIVAVKILPKIHGSRQRLEPVLRGLIDFAEGSDDSPSDPRLPITAEKLSRMLPVLLDTQFVTFTE